MAKSGGMARPQTLQPLDIPVSEQTNVKVLEFFRAQKGMDLRQLPDGTARGPTVVENMDIRDGTLQQSERPLQSAAVGSNTIVLSVFHHYALSGAIYWIVLKRTGVGNGIIEIHQNGWTTSPTVVTAAGVAVTFANVSGVSSGITPISMVSWGDRVLIADGTDTIIDVNVLAGTYALVAGSPVCKHIAIVNNRVVATGIANLPNRVQWSVKNNYADWAGLGSGFEDIRETSGAAERLGKIVPYDERFAYLFGDRGLYGMVPTEYFDAPFRFSMLSGFEGTSSPYSVARTREGLAYVGKSNVWHITREQRKDIGTPIMDYIKSREVDSAYIVGAYDARRNAYVMTLPNTAQGAYAHYCFFDEANQWTRINTTGSGQISSLFEYPDLTVTVAAVQRTQYASVGFLTGGTQTFWLSRDYHQMWEGTDGIATGTTMAFHTPQIIVGDAARTFSITEMQLVLAVPGGASPPAVTWQTQLVTAGGTVTALPAVGFAALDTQGKMDTFVDSTEATSPLRWMYVTLPVRRTITAETLLIRSFLSTGNNGYGPLRVYAMRVHVVEGALFNE